MEDRRLLRIGTIDEPTINYVQEIYKSWSIENRSQEYENAMLHKAILGYNV